MDFSRFYVKNNQDLTLRLLFFFASILVIIIAYDITVYANNATDNDVIGNTLCRLVSNLSGGIARGIATMAIFSVGVGLFLGKLNWGIAAATATGVGVIFGAPKLVAFLSGDPNTESCDTGE